MTSLDLFLKDDSPTKETTTPQRHKVVGGGGGRPHDPQKGRYQGQPRERDAPKCDASGVSFALQAGGLVQVRLCGL